jgi:hypothetical protein
MALLLLATLPLMWLAGSLPPLDAAVFWAGEQLVVHGHGASASATPRRLLVSELRNVSLELRIVSLEPEAIFGGE